MKSEKLHINYLWCLYSNFVNSFFCLTLMFKINLIYTTYLIIRKLAKNLRKRIVRWGKGVVSVYCLISPC